MFRKAIFVLSLMLLAASLGAAQSPLCGDGTYCDANKFCAKPDGSTHSVCAPLISERAVLCKACDVPSQACVTGGVGQVSCPPALANCDNACSDTSQACIDATSDNSACLPKATDTGPVKCTFSSNRCGAGTFCTTNDDDVDLCAPQMGSADICSSCQKSGLTCYQGTQGGQAACLTYVNCANNCTDVKYLCAKVNAADDTGACLEYSTTIGTATN